MITFLPTRWRSAITLAAAAVLVQLAGCVGGGATGELRAVSLTDHPVTLPGNYVAVYYGHDEFTGTSFMLSSVPVDKLLKGDVRDGQILHIELLWEPLAGQTPMDPTATNASIRFIVISGGEMGIYGGAGFALPSGDVTDSPLRVSLEDASIQLMQKTAGFHDLLSPAQLTGSFNAIRDEKKTRELNYAASQLVTNALGRTRYVQSPVSAFDVARQEWPRMNTDERGCRTEIAGSTLTSNPTLTSDF
jgi:hypothetical protein